MREESPELPNFDIAPSNSNGEEFEHQEDHPLSELIINNYSPCKKKQS